MTYQPSTTQLLRVLLALHLVAFLAAGVELFTHGKIPDEPLTGAVLAETVIGLVAVISYVVGLIGLWSKKTWGRMAFVIFFLPELLPFMNDPAMETKLSLSLQSIEMLIGGLIIGLVYFGMQSEFSRKADSKLVQAFS